MPKFRSIFSVFLAVTACGPDAEAPETSTDESPIMGGVQQHLRTEIGDYLNGCTATMIDLDWILMAAHCMSYLDAEEVPGGNPLWFRTSANGVDFGSNGGQTVGVRRTFAFSEGRPLGAEDVMVARLSERPISPPGIIPAGIAMTPPSFPAAVTIWGRGCEEDDPQTGSGIMRSYSTYAGVNTRVLCKGDSGGPKVSGTPGGRGSIYQVNSGFIGSNDVFGNAYQYRSEIYSMISRWDNAGGYDIFASGWCTGATQALIFGDLDGDLDPDAICHDRANGERKTALNEYRFIAPEWWSTSGWCSGSSDKLFAGDFNADGRTDLLCFNRSTGLRRIDFVNSSAQYLGSNWSHTSSWCTNPNYELHTGDFNGDGRTDLLCRDLTDGNKWIDYADTSGHFDGVSDWSTYAHWCSHTGARLYTGDTNGDGRTDLICHTASSGAVDVDFSNGGSTPFGDRNDDELRGMRPGGTELFCSVGSVEVADYDGDGNSDLLCRYSATNTWPSLFSLPSGGFDWDAIFGWGGDVHVRRVDAASQPWQMQY